MKRREFIKGSAILGMGLAAPKILLGDSGMWASSTNRKVHKILQTRNVKVGTLPVLRAFAGNHVDFVSPFVLFDEFGPVDIQAGKDALRVGAHPHAGVTPTTYFLSGSGHHKDSLNYDFQINTGEFMMFNSGKGAIHMEESGDKLKKEGGNLHGFQIWLNMPSKHKYDDPSTVVFKDNKMPTIVERDFTAKVVLGSLKGFNSGIETLSPAFYYDITLKPNVRLDIPVKAQHNAFAYAVNGALELEDRKQLKDGQLALYNRGQTNINLYSQNGGRVFIMGGQPLNEVVYSYGPFVMNTEEQIRKCYADYQAGKMGDPREVNK